MITTWSTVWATSASRWLETSTVRPSSARPRRKAAQPVDALGVEAVGRLVEDQDLGVAEQGGGQAEALAHAEREAADPAAGVGGQPDLVEGLVDPVPGQPGGGGQDPQVVAARRPGWKLDASSTAPTVAGRVGRARRSGGRRRWPSRRSG